jgi:DNA-binding Lrp family transcriptional regulator
MKITIRKKYLFYVLTFSSAVIGALAAGLDTTITALYITNPWALGFALFFVGIFITLLISLVLSIKIKGKCIGKKVVDPSFNGLRLITKPEIKYHVLAGIGNAVLTTGYMILLSMLGDPSVVLPFTQIVILYLVLFESVSEKDFPTLSEVQSALIVTFGAILGSISLTGSVNLESMIIVFLIINPAWVVYSIYQRKLKIMKIKNNYNDSINIRFWNVLFSCFFTVMIVLLFDFINNTNNLYSGVVLSFEHFEWVALSMVLTFFGLVFYIRSLGIGKASVAQSVRASMIIFVLPVSILLSSMGIIGSMNLDPTMLLIKIIGITLILLGIASYALTLVKGYIFINAKPGHDIYETMDKLWNINGVKRVTATAGEYDYIIKIHTRTLMKGYERVIRQIEKIDAIKTYKWQSVLREWEDI